MKKVLLIETASIINGGQKMSLIVSNILTQRGEYEVVWAIPGEGVLSEELKKRGNRYYLLGNLDLPAGVKGKNVIFRYGLLTLTSIYNINRIISKEKIDVLYAPGPASLPWSAVCGAMKHKPVIWHLHHMFLDGMTKKLLNICGRFKSVRLIISVSNAVGNQIANEKAHMKVKALYNPIDYNKYKNGNASFIIGELPFCIHSDKPKLIIEQIGLIHPSKEQNKVIKICGALSNSGYDTYVAFIGKCNAEDTEYKKSLDALAEKLSVRDHIFYLGQRYDVNNLIKGANVVFVPSIEGLSLVALEAMAAEVPVVATDRCGIGELLRVSGAGYTYSEDDSLQKICKIIEMAINDRRKISVGDKFASEHDMSVYTTELMKLFSL